ncbi:hypothetical protein LPJ72_004512 [Coemansia sp. Benny D160-2]|nr:hypothetical protein LPJ72_004512 [Coemansia sp. Benny D160-2]
MTKALYFALAFAAVCAGDSYQRSPCNAVHWTRVLEGKIIVEGRDAKPLDIESLFVREHDLPPNHRIIHAYDAEVTDRRPDRLTIYVDRENIFLNAFCIDPASPMNISTPITQQPPPQASSSPPRGLLDSDPLGVAIAVDAANAPADIRAGLGHIVQSHNVPYFVRQSETAAEWSVSFEHAGDMAAGTYEVRSAAAGAQLVVRYSRRIDAFRALGQILTAARAAELAAAGDASSESLKAPGFRIEETAQFETLALMIDCSRNGVLAVDSVCAMLRQMALMGYNMLQLYTEDTYRVEGEPFFGYLRGGYSQAELRAIDDYADALGIEVVPCIQTLGHLGQMLQWPRYAGLRDTNEVILSKLPETYALLERLIATVSAPLRSRRIHIGMDEAYGVGEGRFRALFGTHEGTAIFVEHLARVHELCKARGLRPMIWSDMLFCLAAKNNALYAYYDQSNNPAEAFNKVEGIPPDIDLVFWDYYHKLPEIYTRKIIQQRELGCDNPWVASAAWTWSRLWCYLPFSFESNRASLSAAKSPAGRVSSFMLTIWGDEGNECDFFSALPVMLYVANHAYTDRAEIDVGFMENSFAAICGGSLGDWMYACRIDEIPSLGDSPDMRSQLPSNMSKWILWEDPMLSFMSPQYDTLDLESHYTQIADRLLGCALTSAPGGRYPLNRLLRMPGLLARALSLKCHLRDSLVRPYRAGDRSALLQAAETRLRPLIEAHRELWLYHRSRWMRIYKPFGWETLELRYGGLMARLSTMYDRIIAYSLKQPCTSLRRSRAIGVTAGVRSRRPSASQDLPSTISAFGCDEDYDNGLWRKPAPLLPPDPDPLSSVYSSNGSGIGSLGEEDDSIIDSIPELDEDLHCIYENSYTSLLLDYARVTTPSRLG